jgi:deferrochelatase/peroxidase EfeB
VLTPPPASSVLAACDVTASSRDDLAALFRRIHARADAVHAAGTATVTAAVGASLFDGRFGLAATRPKRLVPMPEFPGDVPDPAWCHGDLLLQICAERPEAAGTVADDLIVPGLRPRWRLDGFRQENGTLPDRRPTARNLFGFREGAGNPDPGDSPLMDRLVWVTDDRDEPAWTVGGSYQVIRLIRFATALWNAEPEPRQEAVFGRRKRDGVPLGHGRETEDFDYSRDPDGLVIPLDAHIRRANPRTAATADNRILRRGYSYRRGLDTTGRPDEGLAFICFQQDVERGFATVQRRLADEALAKYVLTYGGGYFFVLPGVSSAAGDYLGRALVGG